MLSIDPSKNTERENYKFLIGSIVPRPIAFVTTLSDEGIVNGAPFSYFNIVSSNPPMISLAIQRSAGRQKDTARNIIGLKEFVVHVVGEDNVEEINKDDLAIIYSAIWNDGLLYYDYIKNEHIRKSYKKVVLKCIHNSQNITN